MAEKGISHGSVQTLRTKTRQRLKIANTKQPDKSPRGLRVKPDILVSIHGAALGSCLHFLKPENLSDGEDYRVHRPRGSAVTSCILYSHATG